MEHIREVLRRTPALATRTLNGEQGLDDTESVLCSICRDAGWVHPCKEDGLTDYAVTIPCVCRGQDIEKARTEKYLRWCHLPPGARHMSLDSFETRGLSPLEHALEFANAMADADQNVKWLTLCGNTDAGKTHLSVGICRRWLANGKPARYTFVPLLLKELRDGFELPGDMSYRVRFDALCNIPLLVLDDLGVEKASEWGIEQLQTIVHYRGLNELPLVVTTNRPLDRLKGDDEGRIASRLRRESWCRVVVMTTLGEIER